MRCDRVCNLRPTIVSHLVVHARDAPILPAKFLEKYVGKSKEQNAGKIGGKLEKCIYIYIYIYDCKTHKFEYKNNVI